METARRLTKLKTVSTPTQRQLVQTEKDIFIGFYSVRKLIEAPTKVSDATRTLEVAIAWHANLESVNWRNNHRIDELYDLKKVLWETRDIWFVSSRIMHSFIFAPVFNDRGIEGIFFTSDTDKDKKLYFLPVDTVIDIFERVGHDYPKYISWEIDPDTGTETTVVK